MTGLDDISLWIGLGALAAAGLLLWVLSSALDGERKRLARRLARVGRRPAAERGASAQLTVRLDHADSSIEQLDKLIKRLLPRPALLRERLAKTGRRISLGEYVLANLLVGVLVAFVLSALAGLQGIVAILGGIAAGLWLPHKAVVIMAARRLNRFTIQFPEAIELIVRGLKSGLPVTESIRIVGQEMPDPVGLEFRRIAESFGVGQTLEQALWSSAKRLDTPEFRFFVISLSVQRETGGNLAETLENLANILRRRKQMKLKIKALSSEARASAMIIGSLPFVIFGILLFVNHDYVMLLIHDPRGRIMLGAAALSLLTGIGIMFKMARFEI